MTHHYNHSMALYFFVSHKLNSFGVIKTLIIVLLICGNFVKQNKSFSVAASKNPHVAINNFNPIHFNKHHTFHLEADDDHSLSVSEGNCTAASNCDRKSCDSNITTLTARNGSDKGTSLVKLKPAGHIPNTDIMTENLSSSLFLSQAKSSPMSSSLPSQSSLLLKQQHFLYRPKRYLSFPEGSSFSVAVCFTVGIIGNPRYNYMSFGLNWGVAYDLPNTTWILNHLHGFAKRPIPVAVWHRRSRRSLYKEIENVVDNMGYNGRDCVLRALCESRQYFQKTKMSMIGEMLRAIFSLPKQRIFTRELVEKTDIELYDRAYRKARSITDCSEQYNCGFSLLELAFGKYSTPPDGYYTQH